MAQHFNEGKNARVGTKMSTTCHRALKMYAKAFHMTCGEVLYAACRAMFHKQALVCDVMSGILDECGIPLDKRADRVCFGFACMPCKHQTACKCGVYKGVVEIEDEFLHCVKPSGAAVLQAMQLSAGQRPQSFPQLSSFVEVSAAQRDDLVNLVK
jgi:hypothetical protein|tara:strand:- start:217 stop:681 length:465 start_codon:yes stop_codon:yes gene_type:complete